MALSRIGVSKQPGAQLFEWERGAMNVQNGVDLLGQKGFRSRTYHICIQRSLVRGSTLEFSTPSPPLIRVQDRFECLFFFSFFFCSSTTNAIHLSTIVRMECSSSRGVWRVCTSNRVEGIFVFSKGWQAERDVKFGERSWRLMYSILVKVGMALEGKEIRSHSFLFFFPGIIARAFDIRKFRCSKIIHRIRYVCDTMKNIRRSV